MRKIRFTWVGKLKKGHWAEAAGHYLPRIKRFCPVEESQVKDAALDDIEARKIREGELLLARFQPQDLVICLDEHGRSMTSVQLATHLNRWFEHPGKAPCFVIGGAYGLSRQVLDRAEFTLSLSPMTFPHEMARVVLLEQIYRAATILGNMPYHH
jgi:23S rRNA (pseudouridine1915-N3)-methyltransferase